MNSVKNLIKEYGKEVNIAASSFYVWKTINNLASTNNEVFHTLNENALVWNTITHSLQCTFFVALGRIFDKDGRSLTINSFIRKCRDEIKQFSKSEFEARKLKDAHGVRPEWLDDYLKDLYEPVVADFDDLAQAVMQHEKTYRKKYEPIRHKVIAHKDFATIGSKDSLFAKTNIGEVEEILLFLHQVETVVTQFLLNGQKTSLTDHKLEEEKYIREDLGKLFNKLSAKSNI